MYTIGKPFKILTLETSQIACVYIKSANNKNPKTKNKKKTQKTFNYMGSLNGLTL